MKPIVSRTELSQQAALISVATLALQKSLIFNDMTLWSKDPSDRNWILLKDLNFYDLYLKMKELDQSPPKETTMSEPSETTMSEPEVITEPKVKTVKATSKVTPEKTNEIATLILTSCLDEIGKKLPKKDIVTALGLDEDQVSEALNSLRAQNKVKSGKGRKAQWERIS